MLQKDFLKTGLTAIALVSAIAFAPASNAALATYSQDFEAMSPGTGPEPDLANDGWLVGANVFDGTTGGFLYNYFAFPAPNGGPAFSAVATGEGGVGQGNNQMSIYNDYNNADHGNGNLIEAVVFKDIGTVESGDVGDTWYFSFDTKLGNLEGDTTANAYIKVLDTVNGTFATLAQDTLDTTAIGTDWTGGLLSIEIDASMIGQTLQIGFSNTATNFEGSGVFYDNLNLSSVNPVPVPAAVWLFGSGLLGLVGVARRRKN